MSTRLLYRFANRRLLAASAVLASAGVAASANDTKFRNPKDLISAEEQFHTSSLQPVPEGWTGRVWQIANDYPGMIGWSNRKSGREGSPSYAKSPSLLQGKADAPWMDIDFTKEPEKYCNMVKEYCWEGNVNNEFVVQKNSVRNWYHAPWMHWSTNGREPLNGFTFELPTPPGLIAKSQNRFIQNWACGFYNEAGATVFGDVWKDPANPKWDKDLRFPEGSCVFKMLFTEATEDEIPSLKDSPSMNAVIAKPGINPITGKPDPMVKPDPKVRNDFASPVRLLQVHFAVRDPRAPIGWVFGTFVYNGAQKNRNPWDRLMPVGLMWGNSPELNQAAYDRGEKPYEQWMNPAAVKFMNDLKGSKPMLGWNQRLNGPVDNFVSACASCHSLAQKSGKSQMVPPQPKEVSDGLWVPEDDKVTMQWFRNIPAGEPFTPGATSGDYSLQLMIGYHNYHDWLDRQRTPFKRLLLGTKYIITGQQKPGGIEKREGLRGTV